ncbi:MAG TPA: ATP-binding protein [Solirubrobacteraceae bacterium]|nr:ATP-binding protein [Solirubrobacteraceae bacterium]
MPIKTPPLIGMALRCDHRAPRLARRAVENALDSEPWLDDARLITTELVNNVVLHSGCAPDDIIRVIVRLEDGFLMISVHDPGVAPELPRTWRRQEPGALGWQIVEQLADRWGSEHPGDHCVWAALSLGEASGVARATDVGYASEC